MVGTQRRASPATRFAFPRRRFGEIPPPGLDPQYCDASPAKDDTFRLIFIDRAAVTEKSNRPVGKGGGQMIIGGLTSNEDDTPGPLNTYIATSAASVPRSVAANGAKVIRDETWKFTAQSGEFFELHVKLEATARSRVCSTARRHF